MLENLAAVMILLYLFLARKDEVSGLDMLKFLLSVFFLVKAVIEIAITITNVKKISAGRILIGFVVFNKTPCIEENAFIYVCLQIATYSLEFVSHLTSLGKLLSFSLTFMSTHEVNRENMIKIII